MSLVKTWSKPIGIVLLLIGVGSNASSINGPVKPAPHLFKLTKGTQTSYIFGTLHMGVELKDISNGIVEALSKTQVVYLEQDLKVYLDSLATREQFSRAYGERHKSDCRKVLDLSDPRQLTTYNLILNGVPGQFAGCNKSDLPQPLLVSFARYIFKEHPKGAMDADLAKILSDLWIPTQSLETLRDLEETRKLQEERIKFKSKYDSKQTTQPINREQIYTLAQISELQKAAESNVASYLKGSALETFDYDGVDYALRLRNRAWVEKLQREKRSFGIVVGYRHLYGRGGLLELLKRKGFQIQSMGSSPPYKSNNEFQHIAASKIDIQSAKCMRSFRIRDMDFQKIYREEIKTGINKKVAVGGLLFPQETNVTASAYKLLTSYWDYKLRPIMDMDFWLNEEMKKCSTVLCASGKAFGPIKGPFFLTFLMKSGINLSHLGYDKMEPPIFSDETKPSPQVVKQFNALYSPKEWSIDGLSPYLKGILNLPKDLFPLPYSRLLQSRFEHWRGDRVHSDATMTMYPAMEDLDTDYQLYTAIHEIGHLVGSVKGVDHDRNWMHLSWNLDLKNQKVSIKDPGQFVSAYSRQDFFEDFAESFASYRLSPHVLLRASPEKYAYLRDRIFNGVEYLKSENCPRALGEEF